MILNISPAIERILEAGNTAPSGENCQPWHFVVRGETVEVHLLPERDQSAYSWGQRASFLACGAVIENMSIEASTVGLRADVLYFPNPRDAWHVANLSLYKDDTVTADPLRSFIGKRMTNRKMYEVKHSLTRDECKTFRAAAERTESGFFLTEKREEINRLGRIGSTNEEVMLGNHTIHQFFFDHVNWTKEEDEKKKIGFYIKTLELPPPAEILFRVFRHWRVMRVLGAIGFRKIVAKQNGTTNAAAAAIGALMIPNIEPIDFVKIGRAVERLWLTATSLGLSFQPLTGVCFFRLKLLGGDENTFSPRERITITNAYQEASAICGANGKHIAFMFRVGRGAAPSAHAVRFPLTQVVEVVH